MQKREGSFQVRPQGQGNLRTSSPTLIPALAMPTAHPRHRLRNLLRSEVAEQVLKSRSVPLLLEDCAGAGPMKSPA